MTIKISEEQLNAIVAEAVQATVKDAVKAALQKAMSTNSDIEIVSDENANYANENAIGTFTKEQYDEAIKLMASNRGRGNEPKVGIFWYNISLKQLFGVVSHKRSDYLKPNAGGGLITCSEMHEDVWKKEFYKQKFHNKGIGPFKGEYQNKPLGRVFYSPQEDQYIIAVGEWFNENQEALPLILEEFDLPQDKTVVKQAHHWDIGQTWK